MRQQHVSYLNSEMTSGTIPNAIGKGNPGNMPFFSSIFRARNTPTMTPTVDAKHE